MYRTLEFIFKTTLVLGLLGLNFFPNHTISSIAFAGGGGSDDDNKDKEKDKCEEAKEEREKECSDGKNTKLCQEAKEEKKKACGEETKEEQAAEEAAKEEDFSAQDTQALAGIDGHIAKIIQIRDQANSAQSQLKAIYDQLLADSKNACISAADFAKKKDDAIKQASALKTTADTNVGDKVDMDTASIDLIRNLITTEVGKVSANYQSVATNKQSVGSSYAEEAKGYITTFNNYKTGIENMTRTATGACQSGSSSSTISSSSSAQGTGSNTGPGVDE